MNMKKKQANMWTDLYNLLMELPDDEHFDMGVWRKERPCGTVCCAAGHGVLSLKSWKEAGLYFTIEGLIRNTRNNHASTNEVLMHALGCNAFEFDTMFCVYVSDPPSIKTTPKMVAKRIPELLDKYGYELLPQNGEPI